MKAAARLLIVRVIVALFATALSMILTGCTVIYIPGNNNMVSDSNNHRDFAPIPSIHPLQGLQEHLPKAH